MAIRPSFPFCAILILVPTSSNESACASPIDSLKHPPIFATEVVKHLVLHRSVSGHKRLHQASYFSIINHQANDVFRFMEMR